MKCVYWAVLLLLAMTPAAAADLLRIVRPDEERNRALEEKLAPAPLLEAMGNQKVFAARVVDVIRDEDPATPLFDRVKWLVLAYGNGGSPMMTKPVLVSGSEAALWSEFDSELDIANLVSNRFELMGVAVDSEEHFDALARLFDPGGVLGLSDGQAPPHIEGALEEGSFSHHIHVGELSPQERMALMHKRPYDSRMYPLDDTCHEFLRGIALAEAYPDTTSRGFRKRAIRVYGFLCSLARVNPDDAPDEQQERAKRVAYIGSLAVLSLLRTLQPLPIETFEYQLNPARPLTNDLLLRAALDVVIETPAFDRRIERVFPAAYGLWIPPEANLDDLAGILVSSIVAGGAGTGMWLRGGDGPDDRTKAKARQALTKLVGGREGESQRWTKDARKYMEILLRSVPAYDEDAPKQDFVADLLNDIGWGPPRLAMPRADGAVGRVIRSISAARLAGSEDRRSLFLARARQETRLLLAMMQAEPADTEPMKARIEQNIGEVRKIAAEQKANDVHDTDEQNFLRLLEEVRSGS